MKDKRKAYEEKLDAQLKAKADNAEAGAKIEYNKTIDALQHGQDEPTCRMVY